MRTTPRDSCKNYDEHCSQGAREPECQRAPDANGGNTPGPFWSSTAVIISNDDSTGWYDRQMSPIVSQSITPVDMLNGPGHCGWTNTAGIPGHCGYGPRLPLMVIPPYLLSIE